MIVRMRDGEEKQGFDTIIEMPQGIILGNYAITTSQGFSPHNTIKKLGEGF